MEVSMKKCKFELVVEDSLGWEYTAIAAAQELITVDNALAIIDAEAGKNV